MRAIHRNSIDFKRFQALIGEDFVWIFRFVSFFFLFKNGFDKNGDLLSIRKCVEIRCDQ